MSRCDKCGGCAPPRSPDDTPDQYCPEEEEEDFYEEEEEDYSREHDSTPVYLCP